jgi:predicted RNA-binding protein with PIN domain
LHWVVDGMNVIGSVPDGWWRDRAGARRRLVAELANLVGPASELTVVFDGHPDPDEIDAARALGITAIFAPGGPNAADHAIVELMGSLGHASGLTVVTSDGALATTVRRAGVAVEGASGFRARIAPPRPGAARPSGRRRARRPEP